MGLKFSLLGCSAVKSSWGCPTFQRCVLPQSSGRWVKRRSTSTWRHGATSQQTKLHARHRENLKSPTCLFSILRYISMKSHGGMILTETQRKPVKVPLHPPQISHGLTQVQTRVSAVKGRRLTAWTMTAAARYTPWLCYRLEMLCCNYRARFKVLRCIVDAK
jgi:hypothetical protein